jgi:hypothetical protein
VVGGSLLDAGCQSPRFAAVMTADSTGHGVTRGFRGARTSGVGRIERRVGEWARAAYSASVKLDGPDPMMIRSRCDSVVRRRGAGRRAVPRCGP